MINLDKKFKLQYGTAIYLIAIMAILLCQIICYGIYSAVPKGDAGETVKTALNILFQVSNIAVFLAFIFIKKTKPDIFLSLKKPVRKPMPLMAVFCAAGAIAGLVCLFCFAATAQAGQTILKGLGYNLAEDYAAGITLRDIFLLIITVLFAPVCEELIFRSALASGLKKKFNDYLTAVLVGLAFALMHMNPEQTIYQFFLGFGSTLLALSCGTVIPSVIMHAVSNLIVALDMINTPGFTHFFDWYNNSFASSNLALGLSAPLLAAAGVAAFIFGTKFIKEYAAKKYSECEGEQTEAAEIDGQPEEDEPEKLNKRGVTEKESFFVKHRSMLLYALGIAICAFMWISVFASNFGDKA